jgi:hypothetical protein
VSKRKDKILNADIQYVVFLFLVAEKKKERGN